MRLVEHAHDLGELRLASGQLHGDGAAAVACQVAEARELLGERVAGARVGGHDFDGRAADLLLQLRGRALGDDLAVVDDPHAVGQRVGLLEVLRGQEHGHALVVGEPRDLLPQRAAALQVQARRRLVEEQDARAVHERQREVQAALHAARVAADAAVGGFGQADALEQLLRAARAVGLRHSLQRRLQHQVLATGEDRVERGLLQRGADRRAHLRALAHDVEAADARAAAGRRQQRREHQHRRRLARAVGPEEAVDLTGRDGQVDAVDRARSLAELAHELLDLDCRLRAVHVLSPGSGRGGNEGSTRNRRAGSVGSHQFQRPNSETTAGTSSARITVASSRMPCREPRGEHFDVGFRAGR